MGTTMASKRVIDLQPKKLEIALEKPDFDEVTAP
jgi:hypothetical protein